jgi:hypothetical protein
MLCRALSLNPVKASRGVRAIKEALARRGLENATVVMRQDETTLDFVKLTFVVNEQP